jgi:hypothetical protein
VNAVTQKRNHTTCKSKIRRVLIEKMGKKSNGRKVHYNVDRQLLSEEDTLLWLFRRYIKVRTESEVIAALDEALQSKYLLKNTEIQTYVKTMTRH